MKHTMLIKSFLCAGLAGGIALSANAQVIFSDTFESYADNDDMLDSTPWVYRIGAASGNSFLAGDPVDSNNTGLFLAGGTTQRYTFPFGNPAEPSTWIPYSDANPVWFEFNFYDTGSGNPELGRNWGLIGNSSAELLTGERSFIAMGLYSHSSGDDPYDPERYQVRMRTGNEGGLPDGIVDLAAARVDGWVNFAVEIKADTYTVYVNGVADPNATSLTHDLGVDFNLVAFGRNSGGGIDAHYDDVLVEVIPEPGTYALIFGGFALFGAFVWRWRARR